MLSKIMPREGRFFDLFEQSSNLIEEAAQQFKKMLSDLPHAESHAHTIKDIEHRADDVTHQTVEMLHKTFITPIDREEIHQLISKMDDVVDIIEAASQRIVLYGITAIPQDALQMSDVCIRSAECIKRAVRGLSNLKKPQEMIKDCVEINRLENEADTLLRSAISKLFKEEPDTRQLIKLKEIYELLEVVTDRCEDVANIIEGIVLEYA